MHLGRVFPIAHEKNHELAPEHRKYKGRVVFQGNNVKDENSNQALFHEMGSSASLLAASKLLDLIDTMPGNVVEQSDAPQAYTQSLLGGEPTWIFLPRPQWPEEWKGTGILSVDFDSLFMVTPFLVCTGNAIRGTVCSL